MRVHGRATATMQPFTLRSPEIGKQRRHASERSVKRHLTRGKSARFAERIHPYIRRQQII